VVRVDDVVALLEVAVDRNDLNVEIDRFLRS